MTTHPDTVRDQALEEATLYQHDDGRYGLSFGPAKFAVGDPSWHRVPLDVVEGAQVERPTIRDSVMVEQPAQDERADRDGRQTAGSLREPVNGEGWKVHWWNESMRLLLPDDRRIDSHRHYQNGTTHLTIKAEAQRAKEPK